MEGTCLCGAITVRINDSELFTKRRGHICRCANCKKTAGSGKTSPYLLANSALIFFIPSSLGTIQCSVGGICLIRVGFDKMYLAAATNLIIENEKIEIIGEENLKRYEDKNTLSGTPLGRYFCGTCGKYVSLSTFYSTTGLPPCSSFNTIFLFQVSPWFPACDQVWKWELKCWLTNPSPIKSVTPLYEGKSVLKLGIFPKIPTPEWESFSGERQAWEKPLDGTVQYKGKSFGEKME